MRSVALKKVLSVLLCAALVLPVLPLHAASLTDYTLYLTYSDIQANKDIPAQQNYNGHCWQVYHQQLPTSGGYSNVYLAQNEREGFQVYFYEWYDPRQLKVEVSDFVNAAGETLAHTICREGFFCRKALTVTITALPTHCCRITANP